eukprot:g9337.t1
MTAFTPPASAQREEPSDGGNENDAAASPLRQFPRLVTNRILGTRFTHVISATGVTTEDLPEKSFEGRGNSKKEARAAAAAALFTGSGYWARILPRVELERVCEEAGMQLLLAQFQGASARDVRIAREDPSEDGWSCFRATIFEGRGECSFGARGPSRLAALDDLVWQVGNLSAKAKAQRREAGGGAGRKISNAVGAGAPPTSSGAGGGEGAGPDEVILQLQIRRAVQKAGARRTALAVARLSIVAARRYKSSPEPRVTYFDEGSYASSKPLPRGSGAASRKAGGFGVVACLCGAKTDAGMTAVGHSRTSKQDAKGKAAEALLRQLGCFDDEDFWGGGSAWGSSSGDVQSAWGTTTEYFAEAFAGRGGLHRVKPPLLEALLRESAFQFLGEGSGTRPRGGAGGCSQRQWLRDVNPVLAALVSARSCDSYRYFRARAGADYFRKWLTFLAVEEYCSQTREAEKGCSELEFAVVSTQLPEFVRLKLVDAGCNYGSSTSSDNYIRESDTILLSTGVGSGSLSSSGAGIIAGVVTSINSGERIFTLRLLDSVSLEGDAEQAEVFSTQHNASVWGRRTGSLIPLERAARAVKAVTGYKAPEYDLSRSPAASSVPISSAGDVTGFPLRLTASQQQQAFLAATSRRLTLIQGPPGTGKSVTAAAIAIGFVEHHRRSGSWRKKVLLAADSNCAADRLYSVLQQHAPPHLTGPKIQRVGEGSLLLLGSNKKNGGWESAAARTSRMEQQMRELRDAEIVVSTCVGSGGERLTANNLGERLRFAMVIVDEATQSLERHYRSTAEMMSSSESNNNAGNFHQAARDDDRKDPSSAPPGAAGGQRQGNNMFGFSQQASAFDVAGNHASAPAQHRGRLGGAGPVQQTPGDLGGGIVSGANAPASWEPESEVLVAPG